MVVDEENESNLISIVECNSKNNNTSYAIQKKTHSVLDQNFLYDSQDSSSSDNGNNTNAENDKGNSRNAAMTLKRSEAIKVIEPLSVEDFS